MRDSIFLSADARQRPVDLERSGASSPFGRWRLNVVIEAGSTAVLRWRPLSSPPHVFSVEEEDEGSSTERKWMVESAGSPGGPFFLLSDTVHVSSRQYVDGSIRRDKLDDLRRYYRVTLLERADGESEWAPSLQIGYHPEWWAGTAADGGVFGVGWGAGDKLQEEAPPIVVTARSRISTMLRTRSAEACYLYRPESEHEFSSEHVDPLTGTVMGDDFTSAQSTFGSPTYSPQGYYAPMATFISMSPVQGKGMGVTAPGVMPHWPPPQIGDRLRMVSDASVMEVVASTPNHAYGFVTHWTVVLMHLETSDPITNIPMPIDHPFTSGHARRQMARAANLESFYQSQEHGRMSRATPDLPPWQGGPGPASAGGRGWDE